MIGDQQDFVIRIKHVLPLRWFPDSTPVLDTLLNGIGSAWTKVYDCLKYVTAQARILSAEDTWLDLAAEDFFGFGLARYSGESDPEYRHRIQLELIRERGTRKAISSALIDLTDRAPGVFEPANTADTGGYCRLGQASCGMAYGISGGWGSISLPFQFFVTAYRRIGGGVGSMPGWGCDQGGYCQGTLEYANLVTMHARITDADLCAAITAVLPVGVVAWTRISS